MNGLEAINKNQGSLSFQIINRLHSTCLPQFYSSCDLEFVEGEEVGEGLGENGGGREGERDREGERRESRRRRRTDHLNKHIAKEIRGPGPPVFISLLSILHNRPYSSSETPSIDERERG